MSLDEERPLPPKKEVKRPPARLRSGSATTTTSDSADEVAAQLRSQSSLSSLTSSQPSGPSSQSSLPATNGSNALWNSTQNGGDTLRPSPINGSLGVPSTSHSVLSPIASRVRANDAGAMAEYMKRSRSGSQGEGTRHVIVQASSHAATASSSATPPIKEESISQKYSLRRLRPSLSAAALRQAAATSSNASPTSTVETPRSRFRAGTNPSPVGRTQFSPPSAVTSRTTEEERSPQTPRRIATSGPPLPSLPEPANGSTPPSLPPKDLPFTHRRGPSVS